MEKLWFLYIDDRVQGPYSTDEVTRRIHSSQYETGFVWWKGQKQWTPIESWSPELQTEDQYSALASTQWRYRMNGLTHGPFSLGELIDEIRPHWNNAREIDVSNSVQTEWRNLFQISEIMELLGLCMRVNERVSLTGSAVLWKAGAAPLSGATTTVSIGGLGVTGITGLKRNDEVKLEISSPDFSSTIHAQGRIAYVNAKGEAGVLFERLHAEYQSILMDYVRRRSPNGRIKKAA